MDKKKLIKEAEETVLAMDKVDGFSDRGIPYPVRLRTVEAALDAGLTHGCASNDWSCAAEAFVMLKQINKEIHAKESATKN